MKKPLSKTAVVFILHSIPYGKGKAIKCNIQTYDNSYQSPMGKVKLSPQLSPQLSPYQSPMGKVKKMTISIFIKIVTVSIPYGKGKAKVIKILVTGA